MAQSYLEIEVKFLLADRASFREQLLIAGAVLHRARRYEYNVRLETADLALQKKWQLLRLRKDTAVTLTLKGPAPMAPASEVKVREELEIKVDDFETTLQLLQRLGYNPLQVYEKYRETFHLEEVEIVIDELPFGDFVELEGPERAIKKAAFLLGLDWQQRILTNYLGLFDALKLKHDLPFNDLTFDNFATTSVRLTKQ